MERIRPDVVPLIGSVSTHTENNMWVSICVVEKAVQSSEKDAGGLDNVRNATITIWETIEYMVCEDRCLTLACIFGMVVTYVFWKGRVYGDSWKKYGEQCSIFSNVARKFDRLENIVVKGAAEGAEAKSTTIVDMLVYSTLWMTWLAEHDPINVHNFVRFAIGELIDKTENIGEARS